MQGFGWYGQHNSVRNIADHLKSLHTCPTWVEDSFYVCDVHISVVSYNIIGSATAILAQIVVCFTAVVGW